MITASKGGRIARMRPTTSCRSMVEDILYPSSVEKNNAMKWGIELESQARMKLQQKLRDAFCKSDEDELCLRECGLFIDRNIEWLGASPDAIIVDANHSIDENAGCVELKGIYFTKNLTIAEGAKNNSALQAIFEKEKPMQKNHVKKVNLLQKKL